MGRGKDERGKAGDDRSRREPFLNPPRGSASDVHVTADDTTLPGRREPRSGGRVEPVFGPATPAVGAADLMSRNSRGQDQRGSAKRQTQRRRRRSIVGQIAYWCMLGSIWGVVGAGGLVTYEASKLPPIDQLAIPKRPPNIAILGSNGVVLANRGDTGGAAVALRDLPPYLPKAFVAIEDRRFYSHWGVDPLGIARAVMRNATGGAVQGGSTLTQQLAKNLFLTQERTLSRKIQEAILAVWLEHKYSKDQILELYLNRVYFGSGAYGIEAAAHKYYGVDAKVVTVAQAAVLAGLMKAPTKLAPNRNPQAAAERAAQVIEAMRDEGFIQPSVAKLALAQPAQVVKERDAGSVNYAADYVMDTLDDTVGAIESDIVVTTTIDPAMQAAGEKALVDELNQKGGKFGVSQGALVAMDGTGAIKALIGGRNYAESQFNRAVAAKRQPGSSFKPFVYLTAIEHGLTPDTVRDDAPINVKGWQPENYSRQYFGPVTLTNALALSLNTVAVRLGVEVGPKAICKTAHRLGITSDLQPNASIALGTSEVSPLELVTAYAPFSNGGIGIQPHIITRVKRADGKLLYQRKGSAFGRVVDPQPLAMMNTMMQETLLTGTARKAELPGWQAAGKTGTSQDWRDAWFVGYTGALVAGVWLGNDDGTPTKKTSGGNLPVDIWSRFMKTALGAVPPIPLPGGTWHGSSADTPVAAEDGGARDPATGHADPLLNTIASLLKGSPSPPPVPTPPARQPMASAAPMTINQSGQALTAPPARVATRRPETDALLPPASIPADGAGAPNDDRSLLDRLFGG